MSYNQSVVLSFDRTVKRLGSIVCCPEVLYFCFGDERAIPKEQSYASNGSENEGRQ